MEEHRGITEEDLLMTEARIAESYSRLKLSIRQTPSQALQSVSRTIAEHPLGAAATVGMGGILGAIILGMRQPHIANNKNSSERKAESRPDLVTEILSALVPMATPYIAKYIGDYLGSMLAAGSHTQD